MPQDKRRPHSDFIQASRIVFTKPPYIIIALIASYVLLLIASWLPNIALLRYALISEAFSFFSRLSFVFGLKGIFTNATTASLILLFIVTALAGINVAMLGYYMQFRARIEKEAGTTVVSTFLALIGIGCASCGSVVLSSFFGIGASAAIVGFLPLKGLEFQLLAIILLLYATSTVAKKICAPLIC